MTTAFRVSQRIATLTARVASIRSAPALPSDVAGLRLRLKGLKGNAGLGAWTRESLPGIAYSSPHVKITSEQPPTAAEEPIAAVVSDSTPSPPSPSTASPWQTQPGVFIEFNDPALSEVFLPFTKARSDVLAKRFWDVVSDPAALELLRKGGPAAVEVEEEVAAVEEMLGLDAEAPTEGGETAVKEKKEGRLSRPVPLYPPTLATSPLRALTAASRTTFPRAERRTGHDVAQFLPIITRERNLLLANLRHHLATPSTAQGDRVWDALVQVVQYPAVRPSLPYSQVPSSSRPEDDEDENARLRIKLTKPDLVRALAVFSAARPRTRAGLSRMLVVVELLAMREGKELPPAGPRPADGRDFEVGTLRGGGAGLDSSQWRALISFAALSYRSPRPSPDASSAMSLFSQWSTATAAKGRAAGTLRPTVETYNALLTVAARSKSWGLVEGIEERMLKEGVRANARTVGIRMGMAADRGAHIDAVWTLFEEAYFRLDSHSTEADRTVPWNSMVWHMARRGLLDDANAMFLAMWSGQAVDLRKLAPRTSSGDPANEDAAIHSSLVVKPPPPDIKTFVSLVQAFAFHGDLRGAMRVVELMLRSAATPTPRIKPCEPNIEVFTSLFRGFATHGSPPDAGPFSFDAHLLAGPRSRANADSTVRGGGLFPSLRTSPSPSSSSTSVTTSPWTLAALHRLFTAFLAVPPPPKASSLPYGGQRTAPSAKQIFWVLLAFEKLSGGDSRLVLDVWDAVVAAFGARVDDKHPDRSAWRGWMVDARVRRRVEDHQLKVAEAEEEALNEGQDALAETSDD
ncbi:hypothetical protein RQP46_006425 [Phenoliferia psychrophenolica]